MIAWFSLYLFIATEVSTAAEKCLKNDFPGTVAACNLSVYFHHVCY